MPIISAKNVSIRYLTGDFKDIGLKEFILRHITRNYHVHEFWADKDISFELERGDMLGIIGANGAGKSTLLKAVSGIMTPTEGEIQVNGTVAALLELGSGFDADLTVHENTYLRGALLGYTRKFMDEMYDQIIEFAELEEFQDRPFKQLSSGMKSRLAFSIACLVKPDILILNGPTVGVDIGAKQDIYDLLRRYAGEGMSILIASDDVREVETLCNRVLVLRGGRVSRFLTGAEITQTSLTEAAI